MARRSPIESLLAPRVAALAAAVPRALEGEVEGVHQARVASRRVREALGVCAASLDPQVADGARKRVRRVTRALGPVRELDVSAALFAEHVQTHVVDPTAAVSVRRSLASARSAALRRAKRALTPGRQARLLAVLDAAVATPAHGTALLAAIDARVASRVDRVHDALRHAGTLYVPERLHLVRIAVKQLRYATELAGEARRARVTSRLAALRSVQDLLGRAHDLHVLSERLGLVERRLVRTSRRTAGHVHAVGRAIDDECRQLHASFLSRREALLAVCAALHRRPAALRRAGSAA